MRHKQTHNTGSMEHIDGRMTAKQNTAENTESLGNTTTKCRRHHHSLFNGAQGKADVQCVKGRNCHIISQSIK